MTTRPQAARLVRTALECLDNGGDVRPLQLQVRAVMFGMERQERRALVAMLAWIAADGFGRLPAAEREALLDQIETGVMPINDLVKVDLNNG